MVEGRGPSPLFVMSYLRGLPDDSMTYALMRGGIEHLGWGAITHLLADIYDGQNAQTRATGNFKRPPKFDPHPRPKGKKSKKKASLADLAASFGASNLRR